MKGKIYFGIAGVFILAVALFFVLQPRVSGYAALNNFEGSVDFHKSGGCGCCNLHMGYLSRNGGLNVNEVMDSVESLESFKEQQGVPNNLRTCHTAVIDGYFVEGHVPLEAINKLLEEKPDIAGIALPGMPAGSPGMPGVKDGEWIIYGVNHDGSYQEFMVI